MRVVSLGSGSSGNALLVEAGPQGRTRLLIDAGLSARTIIARLRAVGVAPEQLQGILVTHEHSDHVLGIPTLVNRYALPIVTDPLTYAAIEEGLNSGRWRSDSGKLILAATGQDSDGQAAIAELESLPSISTRSMPTIPLASGSRTMLGDIEIQSFPTSHDAAAPCGYLLSTRGCRMCIVTDSGEVTTEMLDHMRLADLLILESNHDRQRLLRGPYPHMLKERILSPKGHLSNDQAADAVLRTWRGHGLRWLWLAHISRTNNTPDIALKSMRANLQAAGVDLGCIHISVLPPTLGHIWDSTQLWHAPALWQMEQ
jgi:phosphoribosyl 1,2-cyclic phosphodiesterase